jgi:uncharacterized protein (DUF1800 family)
MNMMERRSFFSRMADALLVDTDEFTEGEKTKATVPAAVHPKLERPAAGLEPFVGTFGTAEALHLLRRTTFGPTVDDLTAAQSKGLSATLNSLLATPTDESSQPLIYDPRDSVAAPGQTWVDKVYQDTNPVTNPTNYNPIGLRTTSLKAWWVGLMLNQQLSIREQMTLFWHNHFVTEMASVSDPRFTYRYLSILRSNALGNFKEMVRQISTDGAMLRYLNGNTNTKASPNENYGRELQELFTIGKGPEVAPGDYTNYTEADVKAAARVLTGWKDYQDPTAKTVGSTTSSFTASIHDSTDKQFSARYNNTVITGGASAADGPRELGALLDMIFGQTETAKFICRKLYRWFVYYTIDDTIEATIIAPMASQLIASSYNVLPVLRTLLSSAHFFDPLNRGCKLKSPLDHLVGVCRQFNIKFPNDSPPVQQYGLVSALINVAAAMEQNIGDPPNVAGWPAYYQVPQFYELWINTDTLPKRGRATAALITSGYSSSGGKIVIDPIAFLQKLLPSVSDQSDPNIVITTCAQFLFASQLTAGQLTFLKGSLIPGLPDYEWGAEWNTYLANPTNATNLSAVKNKLTNLFNFMMSMPEFQLL